ncbi:CAP domain-containing protein [Mameliella sediminis]|uniref:CAP domain-containing protein n=1 Tax=Mameliella sediminis TaxID=2836866 RepID=UPI001C44FDC7|nr:CAP domain-containing protein [Mameliella sediminis]MBY6117315.1 CAP domain-containing protein [Antarctobacter heliothermus]MBY6147141.1 CAP domain-containing protein [Mameliella alba]MBV7397338.1 CAP domain-containing protein [Mameliella sediminis]MBY6172508.1 CAP domain-containing protein [Mameliella alba]MCA0957222.1 CAP domain-containing protein [Mameliella alba]
MIPTDGSLERHMLDLVNTERMALGLVPMALELRLNAAARAHSAWMVGADRFGHGGAGGSTPADRMIAARMDLSGGWRSAENIAAVSVLDGDSPQAAVGRLHGNLMNSPGHRANLLDPGLPLIGIGFARGLLSYGGTGPFDSLLVTQNMAATGGRIVLLR